MTTVDVAYRKAWSVGGKIHLLASDDYPLCGTVTVGSKLREVPLLDATCKTCLRSAGLLDSPPDVDRMAELVEVLRLAQPWVARMPSTGPMSVGQRDLLARIDKALDA